MHLGRRLFTCLQMFPQQSIHGLQKQPPHRLQRMKSHGETKEIMFPFLSFLPALLLLLHYNNHPPSPQPPQQSTSDLIKTKRHIIIITFALHKTETIFLCNNCSPTRGDIKICRPSVRMHCLSVCLGGSSCIDAISAPSTVHFSPRALTDRLEVIPPKLQQQQQQMDAVLRGCLKGLLLLLLPSSASLTTHAPSLNIRFHIHRYAPTKHTITK